ncbi:MAG: recombinase [Verrucomicrobia bacterium]|nr:recombinase [Verrucomicrobiota bacterium]
MSEEFEQYERSCEEIRVENAALLKEFAAWVRGQGVSERTVWMHLSNAAFYIQEFLLYEQPLRPQEGVLSIGMYLGYWFIRKGPIATPGTVKSNATSLSKFYSFLVEKGLVTAEQLDRMRKTIKTETANWQERARRYNNLSITDPGKIWI